MMSLPKNLYWARPTGRSVFLFIGLPALLWPLGLAAQEDLSFVEDEAVPPYSVQGSLPGVNPWPGGGARLFFDYQDETHFRYVQFLEREVRLVAVDHGREQELARGRCPQPPAGLSFTFQRRPWRMALICEGEIVATAYAEAPPDGRLATPAGAPVQFANLHFQPLEEVFFSDDFMRTDAGEWETAFGQWQNQGVTGAKFDPSLSANPFVYRSQGPDPALAVAGYWFWDNYRFEVAVKPESEGTVGLALYVQDPKNYLLFRWASPRASGPHAAKRQLVLVRNGRDTILAEESEAFLPNQWYRLATRIWNGRWEAFVDERPVLSATTSAFGQGSVGLFADGCTTVRFDDVRVESCEGMWADFATPDLKGWQRVAGEWTPREEHLAGNSAKQDGLLVTGASDWDHLSAVAEVRADAGNDLGWCVGYRDPRNYYLVRWAGDRRQEIIRVSEGQTTVLATGERPRRIGAWEPLRVELRPGYVGAYVGAERTVEAALPTPARGPVGLYVKGSADFDNVEVTLRENEQFWPDLTEQFTKEETMKGWANPASDWWAPAPGTFWHKGDFYGDTFVQARLTNPAPASGSVTLALAAQDQQPASGYELLTRTTQNTAQLDIMLTRRGRALGERQVTMPEGEPAPVLTLERRGRAVLASLEGKPVLTFTDDQPLTGRQVGVRDEGLNLAPGQFRVWSANFNDDTFADAPADWFVQYGTWETTERWTCSPQWSFFGGFNHRSPTLWSKSNYAGDVMVQAFMAIRMHDNGYANRGDLNVTICGNGVDVSSGYSLVYGGWGNTLTRLFRQGEVVAETNQARLPSNDDTNLFHRHWWDIRLQKAGHRVRAWVDDQLVLEYEDPDPLPGGKVALWTLNKGILVARARVWYERPGEWRPVRPPDPVFTAPRLPGVKPPEIWSATHPAHLADFETPAPNWAPVIPGEVAVSLDDSTAASGRCSLKVMNLRPGGNFEIWAALPVFDAVRFPTLEFDYKIPPGVKVNLQFTTQNVRHAILLTGPEQPAGNVKVLGKFENVRADDQWHHTRFPLLEALRQLYPNAPQLLIETMTLGNPNPDIYFQVGLFGGNRYGDTYHLDNFRAGGTGGSTAAFRWAMAGTEEKAGWRYACALDQRPDTEPQKLQTDPVAVYEGLAAGVYYFHLRPRQGEGPWQPTLHYQFTVDPNAPDTGDLLARGFEGGYLQAEYFNDPRHDNAQVVASLNQPPPGPFFTDLVLTRRESTINFEWAANNTPSPKMNNEYWTARWTGNLNVRAEGDYTFHFDRLDDGARLFIDGELVLDAWKLQPPADHASEPVHLTAGRHAIQVEYYQGPGPGGEIHLLWAPVGGEKEILRFAEGLQGEYYDDPDQVFDWSQLNQPPGGPLFTKQVLTRADTTIDFTLVEKPAPEVQDEYWSARWTGRLRVPRPENYTFYLDNLDDAARVYLDGQLILDAWKIQSRASAMSQPIPLTAGLHDIRVEYHQAAGPLASCQLSWSSPSFPKEVIPPYSRKGNKEDV